MDRNLLHMSAFVCALSFIYFMLMFILFHRQALRYQGLFQSDMEAYILEMLGEESGYDFPYPILFWAGRLFLFVTTPEASIALAVSFFNTAAVFILAKYFWDYMKEALEYSWKPFLWKPFFVLMLALSIFFVSMLYAPKGVYLPGMDHKYMGVFTANPYHNATYLAARPFTIVAFFKFLEVYPKYQEEYEWKKETLFGLFLLLSTMTKPSFTFVFVPAAGLCMLYQLIRSKGKNWKGFLRFGCAFIPTFLALLYQFRDVFMGTAGEQEKGIGIGFLRVWGDFMTNIPFAIVLALAFPGLVLVLNFKAFKQFFAYRFSWYMVAVSLFQFAFLYEIGERLLDMNFSWGYMCAIFFAFVAAVILLVNNTFRRKQKKFWLLLEWLAFFWHIGCGIGYFLYIYAGEFYYCF